MKHRLWAVSLLLLGSGFCSLVYQVVWLRELRLVFGASTPATAAVLAIFMGGLGFGGLLLGRRVDRVPLPLRFYGRLELWIAGAAAVSPFLLWVVTKIYVATGGAAALGLGAATVIRIVLSALVLGVPTFLMGGTLPAVSRAVTGVEDVGRRSVAALYGVNTLGATAGVLVPTFLLLERIGVRETLWSACVLNVLVAAIALRLAPAYAQPVEEVPAGGAEAARSGSAPAPTLFVLLAAAVAGFSFLLMELVWYRMLGPILGGTTYSFGLILAFVLLGIGLGGLFYSFLGKERPASLGALALTCIAEAALIALPYALGDRVAAWALLLQPFGASGFGARILTWASITSLVVLPAAFLSGVQFPILIALLGKGRSMVGRQVGLGYAWNTIGAILGSLAGGFGLLQAAGAPGTWKLAAGFLLLLGAGALAIGLLRERRVRSSLPAVVLLGLTLLFLAQAGPTAAWRHSPIGAGRVALPDTSPNGIRMWMNEGRRHIVWEADGRESSVALKATNGLSFLINGKSDGNARVDAGTQVMYGMVGAILHGDARKAMVIGLGTGSTAGWLGAIPSMERVDVAEIEPAILEVARACTPVNKDVLANPKVKIFLGDAREMMLASQERYDLIASEPSNPYRAGIASLFTREFYEAVSSHLEEDGIFLQWVQAYEVDGRTIRTICATLGSVFPYVETWQTKVADLLFVCTKKPILYDTGVLRQRIGEAPFAEALAVSWRADDLEGFLARFVAPSSLAKMVARWEETPVNTDNHPVVEFGFARTVGRTDLFHISDIRDAAYAHRMRGPEDLEGQVDRARVLSEQIAMHTLEGALPPDDPLPMPDRMARAEAAARYVRGDYAGAMAAWPLAERDPVGLLEIPVFAHILAEAGSNDALPWIERARGFQPAEANILMGVLFARQGDAVEAAKSLARGFEECQENPWPWSRLIDRGLAVAEEAARADREAAAVLFPVISRPFAVRVLENSRLSTLVQVGGALGAEALTRAIELWEPHVPWNRSFLTERRNAYAEADHPLAATAEAELKAFLRNEPAPFDPTAP